LTINAEGRRPLGTSRRRWEGSGSERSRKWGRGLDSSRSG
jgi:hypothetical protein